MTLTRSAVGLRQGKFDVDANGQATYHLPIEVPPGIAGVHPCIGLAYGHQQGNSVLGVGWSLTGLSAITRTKATLDVDGFNGCVDYGPDDRYLLDGQRLIAVSGAYGQAGTVYYAEIHDWSKVVAGVTPQDGFIVYLKNGTRHEYGTTPDSLILAGNTRHVRVWALAATEDLHGNRIEYRYTNKPVAGSQDTGAFYLSHISYTARADLAANRYIDFTYGAQVRPDVMRTYLGGHAVTTSYLLETIAVSLAGGVPVRKYALTYRTSNVTRLSCLETVTAVGADGATLPLIHAGWQDVSQPGFDTTQPSSQLLNSVDVLQTISMDVNGDGITDIVQISADPNAVLHATVFLARVDQGRVTYVQGQDCTLGAYGSTSDYQVLPGDVNGDGLTDLVIAYSDQGCLAFDVFLSTGDGFSESKNTLTQDPWKGGWVGLYPLDADADGRTDFVVAYADQWGRLAFDTYLSQFSGDSGGLRTPALTTVTESPAPESQNALWPVDVNGDGMVDMVLLWNDRDGFVNTTSFVTQSSANGVTFFARAVSSCLNVSAVNQVLILPADANGDGIVDIVQVCQSSSTPLTIQSFLSDAAGGFVTGPSSSFSGQVVSTSGLLPMGFNGGSQTCLLNCWRDTQSVLNATVYGSLPDGSFRQLASLDTGSGATTLNCQIGDANGDGKADLICTYPDPENNILAQPLLSTGPVPDLVNQITNGLGGRVSIHYTSLSDSGTYCLDARLAYPHVSARRYPAHLSPAQFPTQEVIGQAIYVVSNYTLTNDDKVNRYAYARSFRMHYANARIDLNGRGWEGFGEVESTDLQTGLRHVQRYLQDFPYLGHLASECLEADASISQDVRVTAARRDVVLGLSVNTYQASRPVPAAAVYEVRRTGTLACRYDYGVPDYAVASSTGYDNYGNPNTCVWHGYVAWIDPSGIDSTAPFPAVQPLAVDEVVHTHRLFQNDAAGPRDSWALGYLLYEKLSANASDDRISSFRPGDYQLTAYAYAPQTRDLLTLSRWDDTNEVFLTTRLAYDACGNRVAETRPGGATTTIEFEAAYHTYPATVIAPANERGVSLAVHHGYDPRFGVKVAERDENGFTHIVGLDSFGREACRQGPVPQDCAQRDPNQVTALVTGALDFREAVVLTLESRDYLDDGVIGLYTQRNVLQSFADSTARATSWERRYIDGLARITLTATQRDGTQGNVAVLTTYADCGKPRTRSVPFFAPDLSRPTAPQEMTCQYDIQGRPIRLVVPAGSAGERSAVCAWEYHAGQRETVTEAFGAPEAYARQTTAHLFHGDLRVSVASDPRGQDETRFDYDALGRMLRSTDAAGVVNTIAYDALDRKTRYDNPDQNTTARGDALSYRYDADTGLLASITDAAGGIDRYEYDALGRVIRRRMADGRVFRQAYDEGVNGNGALCAVTIIAADDTLELSRRFAYDCYGKAYQETLAIAGARAPFVTTTEFDPLGRVTSQCYPDGTRLIRQYRDGLMTRQDLDGVSIVYPLERATPMGNPGRVELGGQLGIEYSYSPLGLRYGETVAGQDGVARLDFSLDYDLLGQLTCEVEHIARRTESFTYVDKRLVSAEVPGFPDGNGRYVYGPGGNLLSKDGNRYSDYSGHFPRTILKGEDVIYRATQDACGRTASHESRGDSLRFGYDGLGRLASVTQAETVLRRIWSDELGQRLREVREDGSTIYYLGPVYQEQVGTDGGSRVVKLLIDRLGQAASIETAGSATQRRYFRRDRKGNITHVFAEDGALVEVTAFDGFGLPEAIRAQRAGPARYEGKTWDAKTGLYDFGARCYAPATGRFLTPDARLGSRSPERADAWNRFAFELNGPPNHIDPTGHFSWSLFGAYLGMGVLTALGVAGSLVTGGVSDEVAADLDAGIASDADLAGQQAASAAERQSGRAVASRMAIKATGGALSGAATGAGSSGLGYLNTHTRSWNWSGLSHAMSLGAASGSVSGWISGFLAPITPALTDNWVIKVIAGAAVNAGANVAGAEVASAAIDHQGISGAQLRNTILSGLLTGTLTAGVAHLRGVGARVPPAGASQGNVVRLGTVLNRMIHTAKQSKYALVGISGVAYTAIDATWVELQTGPRWIVHIDPRSLGGASDS
ncbi:Rhs1 protein [Burkholderia lata]|uniref:FG-GAP-like repeat-containing protein n=1 Tax=Burkholderia lata (strain ATCC 17760 / DSM 23089 / LMG 22485 / NCIMB 9086 / R18194 / 383) TaxID=482957 RepID=UPI00145481A8|nr:FG-GAP-like repeat-containing protein [Burkholderia lata]VWD50127.1 Rhs1 protein [Burkholderia lata]